MTTEQPDGIIIPPVPPENNDSTERDVHAPLLGTGDGGRTGVGAGGCIGAGAGGAGGSGAVNTARPVSVEYSLVVITRPTG